MNVSFSAKLASLQERQEVFIKTKTPSSSHSSGRARPATDPRKISGPLFRYAFARSSLFLSFAEQALGESSPSTSRCSEASVLAIGAGCTELPTTRVVSRFDGKAGSKRGHDGCTHKLEGRKGITRATASSSRVQVAAPASEIPRAGMQRRQMNDRPAEQ